MKITGRLIRGFTQNDGLNQATIELPEVDFAKIKTGDKVLIEVVANEKSFYYTLFKKQIVYVFPSPEKPSEERVKYPSGFRCVDCIQRPH